MAIKRSLALELYILTFIQSKGKVWKLMAKLSLHLFCAIFYKVLFILVNLRDMDCEEILS